MAAPFLVGDDEGGGEDGPGGRGALSPQARGLYVRVFQRKGPWFRTDSLTAYSELLDDYRDSLPDAERWARAQAASPPAPLKAGGPRRGCPPRIACEAPAAPPAPRPLSPSAAARRARRATRGGRGRTSPPPSRTKWTRLVPPPVLIGHAASASTRGGRGRTSPIPPRSGASLGDVTAVPIRPRSRSSRRREWWRPSAQGQPATRRASPPRARGGERCPTRRRSD